MQKPMMNAVIITNTIPSVKMIHWPPSSACNNYLYMMRTITLLRCIKTNEQNCMFAFKNKSSPSKSQPSSAFPNIIITDP